MLMRPYTRPPSRRKCSAFSNKLEIHNFFRKSSKFSTHTFSAIFTAGIFILWLNASAKLTSQ
jgi:hypothetical protein